MSSKSMMPQSTPPRIGVVVVAYKSAGTISACILSILADDHVTDVVVVDNSADSDTMALLRGIDDPRLQYLSQETNSGFAKGCNVGANALQSVDWIFLVNPDVQLTRTLSELVNKFGHGAIVSGRLATAGGGLNARTSVTPLREARKVLLGSATYAAHYKRMLTDSPDLSAILVDQVDGALLGTRRSLWDTMGGLDEQFELYYEDVDFCERAKLFGPVVFATAIWGSHVGGVSSGRTSRAPYLVSRVSRIRYLRKHFGGRFKTSAFCVGILALETFARTVTRKAEGGRVRRESIHVQWLEIRLPHSVKVLA